MIYTAKIPIKDARYLRAVTSHLVASLANNFYLLLQIYRFMGLNVTITILQQFTIQIEPKEALSKLCLSMIYDQYNQNDMGLPFGIKI